MWISTKMWVFACARIGLSPTNMAPRSRLFKFVAGLVGGTVAEVVIVAGGWFWCTKVTSSHSPNFNPPVARKLNTSDNPPVCIDHAVRTVSLSKLRTTDQVINARILPRDMAWPRVCSSEDILSAQM